jgi:hypothetical protein
VTENEMWDGMLLTLADIFEAGNRRVGLFNVSTVEEYEPFRQCVANRVSDGSLVNVHKMDAYRLTSAGYLKYKPRIEALRALSD